MAVDRGVGAGTEQSCVPLAVWDPSSHAAYLLKNDVYTWQAGNPYGGDDYYQGVGACPATVYPLCSRARVVSFDRPYGDEQGTGDFLWLEAPLVRFAEEHGLDVAYVTDLTVVEHPEILGAHRALLSLGHDECWSLPERAAAQAGSWIFAGTGLASVAVLPGVIGSDVDSLEPLHEPVPANVEVMAHSALPAAQATAGSRQGSVFYSDMTWWTDPVGHAGCGTAAPTTGSRPWNPRTARTPRPREWCSRSPAICSPRSVRARRACGIPPSRMRDGSTATAER